MISWFRGRRSTGGGNLRGQIRCRSYNWRRGGLLRATSGLLRLRAGKSCHARVDANHCGKTHRGLFDCLDCRTTATTKHARSGSKFDARLPWGTSRVNGNLGKPGQANTTFPWASQGISDYSDDRVLLHGGQFVVVIAQTFTTALPPSTARRPTSGQASPASRTPSRSPRTGVSAACRACRESPRRRTRASC